MAPNEDVWERLRNSARALSSKTDSLNAVFASVEKRLIEADVGVVYWRDTRPRDVFAGEDEGDRNRRRTCDDQDRSGRLNASRRGLVASTQLERCALCTDSACAFPDGRTCTGHRPDGYRQRGRSGGVRT